MQASHPRVRLRGLDEADQWAGQQLTALGSVGGQPSVVVVRCMSDQAETAKQRAESVAGVLGRPEHLGAQANELAAPAALVELPETK